MASATFHCDGREHWTFSFADFLWSGATDQQKNADGKEEDKKEVELHTALKCPPTVAPGQVSGCQNKIYSRHVQGSCCSLSSELSLNSHRFIAIIIKVFIFFTVDDK